MLQMPNGGAGMFVQIPTVEIRSENKCPAYDPEPKL